MQRLEPGCFHSNEHWGRIMLQSADNLEYNHVRISNHDHASLGLATQYLPSSERPTNYGWLNGGDLSLWELHAEHDYSTRAYIGWWVWFVPWSSNHYKSWQCPWASWSPQYQRTWRKPPLKVLGLGYDDVYVLAQSLFHIRVLIGEVVISFFWVAGCWTRKGRWGRL